MKTPLNFKTHTIAALFGLSIAFAVPSLAGEPLASTIETITYEEFDEEDPAPAALSDAVAQFGPFAIIDERTAEMSGIIDGSTPGDFNRMMAAYPGIRLIKMIDCPGSEDDDAVLKMARMVRKAGISTHVPANGSIRSGAVEFFLAGVRRTAEPGAEFGVHSWIDSDGREATDYAPADPVHANYVNYYIDMGMSPDVARAFYTFTNKAAPHDSVYYMRPRELAQYSIIN